MSTLLPSALSVLGALDTLVSLYSLHASYRYRSYVHRFSELSKASRSPDSWPSVLLVVPCCGDEPGLEANLEAILSQEYPQLHVRFVVESRSDGAVPAIERALARRPGRGDLVFAGPARGCSQKIHNLIEALRTAEVRDVLAFADSDGAPAPRWMKELVSPLSRSEVGVASSYRFYFPEPPSLPALLRSVWNQSVLTLLGDHDRNFAWGGAMAIRRDVFERIEVLAAWKTALSDDYVLTHAVRRAGLRVEFVPGALVASRGPIGWSELRSWIGRQIAITRVYWPALFGVAAASSTLHASFLVLVPFLPTPFVLGLLGVVLGLSFWSSAVRVKALSRLAPRWRADLEKWFLAYVLLSPLASFLTVEGVLRALVSRRIEWRGKVYEMRSPVETVIVAERV